MKIALDMTNGASTINRSKIGPGNMNLSTSQGFREKVWSELEKAFSEEVYQQCKQVCNIYVINHNMLVMLISSN